MPLFSTQLGVDLGTINVLIWQKGRIVLQEPSLVALKVEPDERGNVGIVEIGQPAREMLGRVDEEDLEIVRPLVNGVIADYEVTQAMLEYFFGRVSGRTVLFQTGSYDFSALGRNECGGGVRSMRQHWRPGRGAHTSSGNRWQRR